MKVQNQEGRDLILIYDGREVYRLTPRGAVNVGQIFSRVQIEAIKEFVSNSDHYVTWIEWKKFLRTI